MNEATMGTPSGPHVSSRIRGRQEAVVAEDKSKLNLNADDTQSSEWGEGHTRLCVACDGEGCGVCGQMGIIPGADFADEGNPFGEDPGPPESPLWGPPLDPNVPKSDRESYAHDFAKKVFCGWLREMAAHEMTTNPDGTGHVCAFGGVENGGFCWRVNRGAPHYGIWMEYPHVWEEVWDEQGGEWGLRPPTFDECIGMGLVPHAISDVAVQHKGMITVVIEIWHKHRIEAKALDYLRKEGIHVLEVPARWVLGQLRCPERIPAEFWLLPPRRRP